MTRLDALRLLVHPPATRIERLRRWWSRVVLVVSVRGLGLHPVGQEVKDDGR